MGEKSPTREDDLGAKDSKEKGAADAISGEPEAGSAAEGSADNGDDGDPLESDEAVSTSGGTLPELRESATGGCRIRRSASWRERVSTITVLAGHGLRGLRHRRVQSNTPMGLKRTCSPSSQLAVCHVRMTADQAISASSSPIAFSLK